MTAGEMVSIRLSAYAHIEKRRHAAHAVYELYIDGRADPRVPAPSSAYTQMGHGKCVLCACVEGWMGVRAHFPSACGSTHTHERETTIV